MLVGIYSFFNAVMEIQDPIVYLNFLGEKEN